MNDIRRNDLKEAELNHSEKRPPEVLGYAPMQCAMREKGKSVLLQRAERMRRDAANLEALAAAIPDNFPLDADEGLWELAIRSNR